MVGNINDRGGKKNQMTSTPNDMGEKSRGGGGRNVLLNGDHVSDLDRN